MNDDEHATAPDEASIPTGEAPVDAGEELSRLRVEYDAPALTQEGAGSDPMRLFVAWFENACDRPNIGEPNAMALATATADGVPSVRMVLLKGVDADCAAFTWFTNLESRKAQEIFSREHPRAAVTFWWPGVDGAPGRQVRVVGRVEQLERAGSAAYFATRPHEAQLGAVVSRQSRPVATRAELEARVLAAEEHTPQLPEHWGGLRLVADEIEFWQGRHGRLHDRIAFLRDGSIAPPADATRVEGAADTAWWRMRLEP